MLRRLVFYLFAASVGLIPLAAGGCNRGGAQGPAFPQPIRDEKEPGESFDTLSAVPDTGSSSVEGMSGSSSETEVEIDEGSSADEDDGDGEGDKEGEKSADADKSTDSSDEGEGGGEDETGDEPDDVEIEIEP